MFAVHDLAYCWIAIDIEFKLKRVNYYPNRRPSTMGLMTFKASQLVSRVKGSLFVQLVCTGALLPMEIKAAASPDVSSCVSIVFDRAFISSIDVGTVVVAGTASREVIVVAGP